MSIEVRNLTHIYSKGLPNESIALDDVSFDVKDGEFFGIIGHTGSGKSTLLQHLNGLLKPIEGQIFVDGVDIAGEDVSMIDIRKKIGLVFQYPEYQLFEESVSKDVAFGPNNLGLEEDEIEKRIKEALELVGMDFDDVWDKSPFDFSGGQKRRIAIAGVIAMKPEVLILDEPTAGLDPKSHSDILTMIEKIHSEKGNITMLVSHNMDDIARLSDRILVLDHGKVAMIGTPREIFSRAEELKAMGLGVPKAQALATKIAERGVDISKEIFTSEDLARALIKELGGDGK